MVDHQTYNRFAHRCVVFGEQKVMVPQFVHHAAGRNVRARVFEMQCQEAAVLSHGVGDVPLGNDPGLDCACEHDLHVVRPQVAKVGFGFRITL